MASGKAILKGGCFGCVVLLVLVTLGTGGMFFVASRQVANSETAERTLRPDVGDAPARARADEDRALAGAEGAATGRGDAPDPALLGAFAGATPERPGRLILTLEAGELRLYPADGGQSLEVDARYGAKSFELIESRREGDADYAWTYEVHFARKGSQLMQFVRAITGEESPRLEVAIPKELPIVLDLAFQNGAADIELGDLSLVASEFDLKRAGGELSISDPTRLPMESLSIDARMGGFAFSRLGNGSPAKLDVNVSMGGGDVDLRGRWLQDADVDIRYRMGGLGVRVPQDVQVEGVEGNWGLSPAEASAMEIPPPVLRFTVEGDDEENIEFRQ